jgi:hypothetical protein
MPQSETSISHFFDVEQGYWDLLAGLTLVIKMGCNIKKFTIYLYNIPEDVLTPCDSQGNMLMFDVPHELHNDAPDYVQCIFTQQKYIGVPKNSQ